MDARCLSGPAAPTTSITHTSALGLHPPPPPPRNHGDNDNPSHKHARDEWAPLKAWVRRGATGHSARSSATVWDSLHLAPCPVVPGVPPSCCIVQRFAQRTSPHGLSPQLDRRPEGQGCDVRGATPQNDFVYKTLRVYSARVNFSRLQSAPLCYIHQDAFPTAQCPSVLMLSCSRCSGSPLFLIRKTSPTGDAFHLGKQTESGPR